MWPDSRIQVLFGIELPIIQAPMAGSVGSEMVIAVSEAGGLGSLPCAMLSPEQMRAELETIRRGTSRPINLNFFCHREPEADPARVAAWRKRLESYCIELGLDPQAPAPAGARAPFDNAMCDLVAEFAPEVVSFHFGLPERNLLERVRATGAKIISSATSVDEARRLEDEGCDAIIAQGYEAGGHRGMFLTRDMARHAEKWTRFFADTALRGAPDDAPLQETSIGSIPKVESTFGADVLATQAGTMALVPQVVDAVRVPVIAAGGIADGRGIAAAFALGASAVQIGTAYLFCPEARISTLHRDALKGAKDNDTVLTNVFTGRPARGIVNRIIREVGPISDVAPEFPLAAGAVAPIRAKAEAAGSGDFSPLWAGQAAALGREAPAGELTRQLAADSLARLSRLAPAGISSST